MDLLKLFQAEETELNRKRLAIGFALIMVVFEFIAALIHFEAWKERTIWLLGAVLAGATILFPWMLVAIILKRLIARLFVFDEDERRDIMWVNVRAQALFAVALFLAWETMSLISVYFNTALDGDNLLLLIPGILLPVILSCNYEHRAYCRKFDYIPTHKLDVFMLAGNAVLMILSQMID